MSSGTCAVETQQIGIPPVRAEWVEPIEPDPALVARLRAETNLPPAICRALALRGFTDKRDIRTYLKPDPRPVDARHLPLPNLHDPALMKDADRLVDHLIAAKNAGETILIHGDYDVDGLSSTSLLHRAMTDMGFRLMSVVPDRHEDGYGMSMRLIERAITEHGIRTVLTCDVGISEAEKVKELVARGVTVLITDHHHVPDVVPGAHAVVNPHQKDCRYPFKELCGAGVAFKVLQLLARRLGLDEVATLYPYLDLVALGTICDVVTLRGENRVLAHMGVRQLRETRNPGLQALLAVMKVPPARVDETTCGFMIGPRLNAIGRIDAAQRGLEMLLTDDSAEAMELADLLDRCNDERKAETSRMEEEAIRQVESMGTLEGRWALALFGDTWLPGIVGIVASRIVERYGLPAFLFAKDEQGRWKGSGRAPAVGDVDLYEMLADCKKYLAGFGGHELAAGATLAVSDEDGRQAFADAFSRAAEVRMSPEDRIPKRVVDLELDLAQVDWEFFRYLRMFAPYGEGNRPLNLMARDVAVEKAEPTKDGKHLRFSVRQGRGAQFSGIGFNMAEKHADLIEQSGVGRADLLFTVDENVFRGKSTLQLMLVDARLCGDACDTESLMLEPVASAVE